MTVYDDCVNCEYKENCRLGLYAVNPCNCIEERTPAFLGVKPKVRYQNPLTGAYEEKPIPEEKILYP